jgi:Uncharacterized ABC-type transport system, permease component
MDNMTAWVSLFAAAITAGTPLLLAAQGELLTERAGILNLGVEGMMLVGAVAGFMGVQATGDPWLALLIAMAGGGLLSLVHGVLSIRLKANQVVSGLALTIFGGGLSGYLGKSYIGQPAVAKFTALDLGPLSEIPFFGPVFFKHDPLVYLAFLLGPVLWFFIYRSRPGLVLRVLGENPAAADALGIGVDRLRYLYVALGGMLAGAGGAYLSLAFSPSWLENMTAGRGWIALALVIFGLWNPLRVMIGAYLFGLVDALGFFLQLQGVNLSVFLLGMLPYAFTLIVLVMVQKIQGGRLGAPAKLGVPYDREER